MTNFVHLHCHSEYSIKTSTIRIKSLINQAKKLDFKAITITDKCNLFAAIKFYTQAIAAGIKPIFGVEITIYDPEAEQNNRAKLLLLCQNNLGYKNLCQIISEGYLHHQILGDVVIPISCIAKYNAGLIAIANPLHSDVGQLLLANQLLKAQTKLEFWQNLFPKRYYLAVQRTQQVNDEQHLQATIKLALTNNTPVVATNCVHFLSQEDFEAHEVRVCIADGDLVDDDRRIRRYTREQYLKSSEQMGELFDDLPEIMENTIHIATRCNVQFSLFKKNYLPEFPTPKGLSIAKFFTQECNQGLQQKLTQLTVDVKLYQKRLNFEIETILTMDFPGYFLIVADFIAYAKKQGIPVGPGRGSGAGSLVAFVLGITNVDPIYHDLLFERFLNPERVSMPDFDIDFCTNRRDEVIAYVAKTYGSEKVSQIITYGTMAAKGVVRDVGRVLGHPYGFSDSLSKLIPNELKMTLDKALKNSPDMLARYHKDEASTNLIDTAKILEGLSRNVGTHAGGVVIAPSKISDFCPIYKGSSDSDSIVSQFDKDDLEAVGLVKFDFLGLSNLTVIDKTLIELEHQNITKGRLDLDQLALDDKDVYKLLQAGNTTGIFQLESDGMRKYLIDLKPDSFADIVAMLALYRPGPLESGMVEDYIAVKHGKKIQYPHPMLEAVLKPTNGGFLYQEQVMKAAQIMAGYTLGGADILRRAMGKKKEEDMAKQRDVFVKGAVKKGVNEIQADKIFDLIDKFSGYGFNKSHSVAYALVSYQTAYLKTHYPTFFMASVLSGMMGDTDRIAFTIAEVKRMEIVVMPPNINHSYYQFSVNNNTIIYGLGAIKGSGQALAEQIAKERKNGPYKDLVDFCCRINKRLLNRRALEALILSGAFDDMVKNRHELQNTFPLAVKQAEQYQQDLSSGQQCLFDDDILTYADIAVSSKAWNPEDKLRQEKEVMGYFFSAHLSSFYQKYNKTLGTITPNKLHPRVKAPVKLLGMVADFRFQESKSGKIALFTLEDEKKGFFTIIQPEFIDNLPNNLADDEMVVVIGKMRQNFKKDVWQVQASSVKKVSDALLDKYIGVRIHLSNKDEKHLINLKEILTQHPGNCPVYLQYTQENTSQLTGIFALTRDKNIKPSQLLITKITKLLGEKSVMRFTANK